MRALNKILRKPLIVEEKEVGGIIYRPCFGGFFAVSSCGKVLGRSGKLLKLRDQGNYFTVVCTQPAQKDSNKYVHRLVAEAWVPNTDPDNRVEVNHIDGDKRNNIHTNLEWVSRKLNVAHAIRKGLNWNLPTTGQQGFQKNET